MRFGHSASNTAPAVWVSHTGSRCWPALFVGGNRLIDTLMWQEGGLG